MGAPFQDIILYTQSQFRVGTYEFWTECALLNYISDLYQCKMFGYKPPNTSRVTIQPHYYGVWKEPVKSGSIVHIAPEFNYEKFQVLDQRGKYKCLLDLIQTSMLELSRHFNWDTSVFLRAYDEVTKNNYRFSIDYPSKISRDAKKSAYLRMEKSETITSLFVLIESEDQALKIKLLDKDNQWWNDPAYQWVKSNKWVDNDRFGIRSKEHDFSAWYSLGKARVEYEHHGKIKDASELKSFFNVENRHYIPT